MEHYQGRHRSQRRTAEVMGVLACVWVVGLVSAWVVGWGAGWEVE